MGYNRKNGKEFFLQKAMKVHGAKYDYSQINYINCTEKVEIICPVHGSFWQTPSSHMSGRGCPHCGCASNTEEFIEKSRRIHGDAYIYSKVKYTGNRANVIIVCPKHGEFTQLPWNHLAGHGCRKCAIEKRRALRGEMINAGSAE